MPRCVHSAAENSFFKFFFWSAPLLSCCVGLLCCAVLCLGLFCLLLLAGATLLQGYHELSHSHSLPDNCGPLLLFSPPTFTLVETFAFKEVHQGIPSTSREVEGRVRVTYWRRRQEKTNMSSGYSRIHACTFVWAASTHNAVRRQGRNHFFSDHKWSGVTWWSAVTTELICSSIWSLSALSYRALVSFLHFQ